MIGLEFSHYRVDAQLGVGGMGVVYRGWDTLVDRPVALKFSQDSFREDERTRARLLREARAAMSVIHENVCPVYGVEELPDGRLCIAMAYCEGQALASLLAAGPVDLDEALRIAAQIASGLGAVHSAGVVHRDIKPSNIILTTEGTIRLLDFGIAWREGTHHTATRRGLQGTPIFMAPEVLAGAEANARSDLFSLGVVLWQLFTGVHPFGGRDDPRVLARMAKEAPQLDPTSTRILPESLLRLLRGLLSTSPSARPANARAVVDALNTEGHRLAGITEADTERLGRPHRRGFAWGHTRAFSAAIVLVLVVVVTWAALESGTNPPIAASGLAVVAPRDVAGSLVSEGLATAIGCELERIADDEPSLWVVPHEWNDEVEAWTARGALDLLGVSRALIVEPTSAGGIRLSWMTAQSDMPEQAVLDTIPSVHDALVAARSIGMPDFDHEGGIDTTRPLHTYLGLAHLRRATSAGDSAVAHLEAAADGSAFARCALAEALLAQLEDPDEDAVRIEELLQPLLDDDRYAPRARFTRGRLALSMDLPEEAETWFQAARTRAPDRFQILRYLAWAHEVQGETSAAAQVREDTVLRLPDFVGSHERMGLHHLAHDDPRAAWYSFARGLQIAPGYTYTFNLLGAAAIELGCWEEAVSLFERSLQHGRSPHATANLGFLYYSLGHYAEAVSMYRWALAASPNDHELVGALAASLWWNGDREEATKTYRRAAELAEAMVGTERENGSLHLHLAGYYVLSDAQKARTELQRGLELMAPGSAVDLLRAASVHTVLGDEAPALDELSRAVALGIHKRRIEGSPFLRPLLESAGYHHLVNSGETRAVACPDLPEDVRPLEL